MRILLSILLLNSHFIVQDGRSAIYIAAFNNSKDVAATLVRAGADVNQTTSVRIALFQHN